MYKEYLKFNNKKMNNQNTYLTKEDIQMTSTHMKRCSASYVTEELEIDTAMSYYDCCALSRY